MDDRQKQEPVGFLSAVYPGSISSQLTQLTNGSASAVDGASSPTISLLPLADTHGRVCEQVWLEKDLFNLNEGDPIFATTELDYQGFVTRSKAINGDSMGSLYGRAGEQLLLHDVQPLELVAGMRLSLADAILEFSKTISLHVELPADKFRIGSHRAQQSNFTVYIIKIVEPGLVEPGAPLLIL